MRSTVLACLLVTILAGLFVGLFSPPAAAGATGDHAVLIVDPSDPDSLYLANVYRDARGIPAANILTMTPWTNGKYTDLADRNIQALLDTISGRGIDDHIDYVVLMPTKDYRVEAKNLVTDSCSSVSNFALASAYTMAFIKGSILNKSYYSTEKNQYYTSGTSLAAFDGSKKWLGGSISTSSSAKRYFIGATLGWTGSRGNTVAELVAMVQRSAKADGTRPSGTFYFVKTNDSARSSPRDWAYASIVSAINGLGKTAKHITGSMPANTKDCLGIMTGRTTVDPSALGIKILDGAFCDHMTSFAGFFGAQNQTPVSEWIRDGASGSVGTVEEPCNYAGKFPSAKLHLFYAQGATLGEAYFRSAQYVPFQAMLYGDPLTRAHAYLPSVSVSGVPSGTASGTIKLTPSASTSKSGAKIAGYDLIVDGVLLKSITSGDFSIDTKTWQDGHHDVHVLARDDSALKTVGRWMGSITTKNKGRSATISSSASSGNLGTAFKFTIEGTGGTIYEMRVVHNGRVVAASTSSKVTLTVHGHLLGAGPAYVQAEALYSDGTKALSSPVKLTITSSGGGSANTKPVAYGFTKVLPGAGTYLVELPSTHEDVPGDVTYDIMSLPSKSTVVTGPKVGFRLIKVSSNTSGTDSLKFRASSNAGVSTTETITLVYGSNSFPSGPTGTVTIDGGATWAKSSTVTLGLTASTGTTQMRFSNDNSTWSTWATYASSKSWTLATGQGTRTVYAQLRDASNNVSATLSDTISVDTTAPAGTVSVAGGATWANSTSVTLTLGATDSASGVAHMRFSNDGSTWTAWETYGTSKSWTLASGDGTKTVYAQFRDNAGNGSSSATDAISLDTTAPAGTLSVAGGAAWVKTTSVTLTTGATDGGSGVADMRFSNDGSSWSAWETYGTSKAWTLTTADGSKTVHVQYRDTAGNASTDVTDGIVLDRTAPSGSIVIAGGAAWTSSASVTLTLSATDAGSGVADMRLSNDGSSWGSWESYATSRSWTLASGAGTRTVHVQYRDDLGNASGSFTDTIAVDLTAPTGTVAIAGGAAWTNTTSVTLTLSATDDASGVSNMRFSHDGLSWGSWKSYATSKSWTLTSGQGAKTVYVQFRDVAGKVSATTSDGIGLDTTVPTASLTVASGATWTATRSVTLGITSADTGSGVAQMRFSDDGSTWSAWETAGSSKSWTLPTGDGGKTVYLQVRDAAGNPSTTASDSISLDATAPTGGVVIAGGLAYVTTRSVSLALSASDGSGSGVSTMRFSHDGSSWTGWESYGASKSWTLEDSDGTRTVHVQIRDAVGNAATFTDTVILDRYAPGGSVTVAGGAAWTTSRSVTLTLSATDSGTGVSTMRFSDDGSKWSLWESYGTSKSWTLPAGDGSKTVYAQFRDVAGNVSKTATDGIGLDTAAPTASLTIASGATWATSRSVTLGVTSGDAGSGVSMMRFSDDGSNWSTWETAAASKAWTLPSGDGSKSVYLQVRDAAGNASTTASDTISLDTAVPTGSLTIAGGATYALSSSVTLALSASDTGSGLTQMRFRSGGGWSAWETYGTTKSWTLAGPDGTKTVELQVRDAAGNVSATASDSIVLDTVAPVARLSIDGGAAWTTTASVDVDIDTDPDASGVDSMRFAHDPTSWGVWTNFGDRKAWTLQGSDGSKKVYAQFRDGAGHVSSVVTVTIGLDRVAPSGSIEVNGGNAWIRFAETTVGLAATDATSGVADMSFRTDGVNWSSWRSYRTSDGVFLPAGDGLKTVSVRFRDAAGNVSAAATDTVTLDATAPTGTILLAGGDVFTKQPVVDVDLTATDGLSGVAGCRFSNDGTTWESWVEYASSGTRELSAEGLNRVYLMLRDEAGNESAVIQAQIRLDRTAPTCSFTVNDDAPYILPGEGLVLDVDASDGTDGSGVEAYRVSYDDGLTWSGWNGLTTAQQSKASENRPEKEGRLTATVVVCDAAGNESVPATRSFYVVEASPPAPGPKAKYAGSFGGVGDVDTIAIDIAAGDVLSAKLKVKPADEGDLELAVDIVSEDGARLHTARLPSGAKKLKLPGFEIPASGRYYLMVYRTGGSASGGTYTLKTKVGQAALNKKLKADVTGGVVRFEAAEGSLVKATIKGDGITAGAVTLVGPDGPVPFEASEGTGKVKVRAVALTAGSGTYEFRVAGVAGIEAARIKLAVALAAKAPGTISL